jgi:hypothetical protein
VIDLPTPELSEEWPQLDPRVRLVVEAIEDLASGYGLPVVVTSLLRPGSPSSPHHYGRACDLSVKHLPVALVKAILELRHRFPYGAEGFSTIILESPHYADLAPYGWSEIGSRPWLLQNSRATGPHLHVQVPEAANPGWEIAPEECYEMPDRLVVEPISRQTITVSLPAHAEWSHFDPATTGPLPDDSYYIIPTGRLLSAHEILRQPAKPAEGENMQHPTRLGWAATLPEGYHLDEIGQVRHQSSGELVCGWSGRGHRQYLLPLPVPDPVAGTVRVVWVDKDAMDEFGRMTRRAGRAATSAGLQSIIRRLLGMAFDVLAGRVLR